VHRAGQCLDLAEPDRVLLPFLLSPMLALLERHAPHRTAHASLIAEIRGLLAGTAPHRGLSTEISSSCVRRPGGTRLGMRSSLTTMAPAARLTAADGPR
jgi:hypothetical protein